MRALAPIALQRGSLVVGDEFEVDCAIAVQLFARRDAEPVNDADRLRLWSSLWSLAGRAARREVVGLFRLPRPPAVSHHVFRALPQGRPLVTAALQADTAHPCAATGATP